MTQDAHQTTRCPHGFLEPVICPQCDPGAYDRARPQAEAMVWKAEASRLRGALERIANYSSASGWENHPVAMRAIAKDALAHGR